MRKSQIRVKAGHAMIDLIENGELLDEGCNGQIRYNRGAIHLMSGLSGHMQRLTVWHELVHLMMYQLGHNQPEAHDEQVVDGLAHKLVEFLVNNPYLVVWTCNDGIDLFGDFSGEEEAREVVSGEVVGDEAVQ